MASSAIEGAAEVHIKSVQVNRITSKAKLDRFMVDYILNQIDDPEEAEFEVHWLNVRMFTKVATVFMKAVTAEQSCKALSLRLSGTPPRGAVYPTGV